MARIIRKYHDNFIKYQNFIVNHKNYAGLPEAKDTSGQIKWVTTGKSTLGQARKRWWLQKGQELKQKGFSLRTHAELSPICLINHPTKEKPCQTCGRLMSLEYVYPTKATLEKINTVFSTEFQEEDLLNIYEIIDELGLDDASDVKKFKSIFPHSINVSNIDEIKKYIQEGYVEKFSRKLSPGAMSNCPDRLDGFHSYNKCCRATEDTGRHAGNLIRYGEDRRAYENWCDGDWKAASWLMKIYNRHEVSADHIGPISLGFSHRPKFQPMSQAQNSSKGNRMSYSDFLILLDDEERGENVISWHSQPLWDRLKIHVKNNDATLEMCKYLRRNMHYILSVLSRLSERGHGAFLESLLNPEYAYYSVKFEGFDPEDGTYQNMVKIKGNKHQYERNAERYKRIAFESLQKYADKKNRHHHNVSEEDVVHTIELFEKTPSRDQLVFAFDQFAEKAERQFIAGIKLEGDLLNDETDLS